MHVDKRKTNRKSQIANQNLVMSEVTKMLEDYRNGNREVLDELLPLVYNELRRLAHSYLRSERRDLTLQTTALVHEAYLKLIEDWT